MRYTPYTEAQIQSMNVMEAGIYTFQVIEVDTKDKFGNPLRDKNGIDMAKLKLLVWDKDNRERTLITYISGDGNFAYKLRHFANAIGMIEDYDSATFDIMRTIGKSGKADIVIKKGTMKNDGSNEMWPDRNDVKDFVVDGQSQSPRQPTSHPDSPPMVDSDIPF